MLSAKMCGSQYLHKKTYSTYLIRSLFQKWNCENEKEVSAKMQKKKNAKLSRRKIARPQKCLPILPAESKDTDSKCSKSYKYISIIMK